MRPLHRSVQRALPHGALGAAVIGWAGGAIAWVASGIWTDTTSWVATFGRLDQVTMMLAGAVVGSCVLGVSARHRRGRVGAGMLAGILLGGVSTLLAATLAVWLPFGDSPRSFLLARLLGWSLAAGLASAALACYTRTLSVRRVRESLLLGLLGGAISGAIFMLPGPAELWQAMAVSWFGAAVGLAAIGPSLWNAPAVVLMLPRHPAVRGLLSLHECPVENGLSLPLGEAQIACDGNRVYVYPPAGGAIINGKPCYAPVRLQRESLLSVGRLRFKIQVNVASVLLMLCFAAASLPAQAQPIATRFHLIRCAPHSEVQCLRAEAPPLRTLIIGAPLLGSSSLARVAWTSDAVMQSAADSSVHLRMTWRPPLFALPIFSGTADSAAISATIRDLVAGSGNDEHTKALIGLLLAMGGIALWMLVPHFAWASTASAAGVIALDEKLLREMTRSRGIALQLGPAPNESAARHPDEITAQTARRTALNR